MSKIKNAFFNTIVYRTDIEKMTDGESIPLDLANDMLNTIYQLEYELALYHKGCSKAETDSLMAKTYKSIYERINVVK